MFVFGFFETQKQGERKKQRNREKKEMKGKRKRGGNGILLSILFSEKK
jgi:hypothetical protein